MKPSSSGERGRESKCCGCISGLKKGADFFLENNRSRCTVVVVTAQQGEEVVEYEKLKPRKMYNCTHRSVRQQQEGMVSNDCNRKLKEAAPVKLTSERNKPFGAWCTWFVFVKFFFFCEGSSGN